MSGHLLGSYAFVPWLRRGISTQIDRVEGDGTTGPRAVFPVDVRIDTGLAVRNAGIELALHGPGEIRGLDPAVVIRTWPRANADDAETNYLPMVELAEADLPWRYTPARANAADRLRPWLVLVVVREDEIGRFEPASSGALPVLTVRTAAALPALAQSWAWAHVQVTGDKDLTPGELDTYLTQTKRVIGRLLSPRRLDARTRYRACVVPAFERGRKAGLDESVGDEIDALEPAWTPTEVRPLPVYHTWLFATGAEGDFEALVRRLEARAVPATVGRRSIDTSRPGSGLGPAATSPLAMEGALMAPAMQHTPWPPAERAAFAAQLASLLNTPSELLVSPTAVRVVAPPIYGCEHARSWRVSASVDRANQWLHAINLDPTQRAAAALGTAVVQAQQRALMAAAWLDADRIRELNQQLRQMQLGREVLVRLYERHLAPATHEELVAVTAPVHSRIKASPITIRALIEDSRVAPGLFETQMRRVARPRGGIARRAGRAPTHLIARVAAGELVLVPPLADPSQLVTTAVLGGALPDPPPLARRERDRWLERALRALAWTLFVLAVIAGAAAVVFGPALGALAVGLAGLGWWALGRANALARERRGIAAIEALREGSIARMPIADVMASSAFVPSEGSTTDHRPVPVAVDTATRTRARDAFRLALSTLAADLGRPVPTIAQRPALAIPHVVERLHVALDPNATIVAALRARLKIAPRIKWDPPDPLEPIMAAPEFPQPMYEPLRDLSQDWLLPGLEDVPPNTVTLVETNQAFIEAYMVGLSHEMARELRWNEFPTDLRGTYFRQFWDVRGYVGTEPAERLLDITPIHGWRANTALGAHSARRMPPGGRHLVLLVRGDLLRRYPNTVVYAVETVLGDRGERTLGATEKHCVFRGTLQPDVTFFGFELTAAQVRGSEDPARHQGWYFVLQEQPSEPRFGLDVAEDVAFGTPVGSWDELSWAHLASSAEALQGISYIDLDHALPDTRGLSDPVSTRWHANAGLGASGARASDLAYATLQRPMRLAVHGSDMLRGVTA
jgi:hypothetical protein